MGYCLGLQAGPGHAGDVQTLDAQGVVLPNQCLAGVMVSVVPQAFGPLVETSVQCCRTRRNTQAHYGTQIRPFAYPHLDESTPTHVKVQHLLR